MPPKTLIVIAGPTAIGKTSLSILLARQLNCAVLSADSRQFYKEMSIGTAVPTAEEMKDVPHYFIHSHSITDDYNVGKYETDAILLLDKLFLNDDVAVLVGGSGLYIDAICKGFDSLPEADENTRYLLKQIYQTEGMEGLASLLKQKDEAYYHQVDLQNPHRVMRALEVCMVSGKPYSELRAGLTKQRNFNIIKIALNTDRDKLYSRINTRVDQMMKNGFLEEVKQLINFRHLNSLQTVGYKELFDYLDSKTDLNTAVELIKQNTRRYAKRQLTWFRRYTDFTWFEPHEVTRIADFLKQHGI